ncbi:MAG TPA: hypothetical protein VMX58_00345 [Patescibacteria group bacterium]|nr:hypothetical protein [Patescibacteria group bacterium]
MRRIFLIPLVISVVPLLFSVPPPVRLVCGLFQAFYLPGIVFLLYTGTRPVSPLDTLFLAPAFSPLILTLLILAVHTVAGSVQSATLLSLGVLYLLLAASPFVVRRRGAAGPRPPAGIVWVAAGLCILFIATYLVNDYQFAYDMVRHSAIANEILYRGMPPLEPFFPDIPIQSNWIAYVFMAAWKWLSGLSMIHAMWVFSCFSIFVFPYLIARITLHFTGRRVHALVVPLFALTGLVAAGWVTWPLNLARVLVGSVHGTGEIGRIIGQVTLNGRDVVQFLAPFGSYAVNPLEKYLIIDVQHYALNLFLLFMVVMLSGQFQRESHWRAAITAFVAMIGAFLFHIFTGIFLLIAAILSGAVVVVLERLIRRKRPHPFHALTIPCCAVAATAIGLFFFASFRDVHARTEYSYRIAWHSVRATCLRSSSRSWCSSPSRGGACGIHSAATTGKI